MRALLVVDAQNEFSAAGRRPVPNHSAALERIVEHVKSARAEGQPIGWVRHYNKPQESKAFVPGTWGAEWSAALTPSQSHREKQFEKDVYGAFTYTDLESWLLTLEVTELLVVGFYAHMCLSTAVREALVRGFAVQLDSEATGARDIEHPALGRLTAEEVRRSSLLQLVDMGATLVGPASVSRTLRAS